MTQNASWHPKTDDYAKEEEKNGSKRRAPVIGLE